MTRLLAYLSLFSLAMAALLVAYGIFALRAGARSAAHGGGLLSGFGLIPLGMGIILGIIAIATLIAIRVVRPRSNT